MDGEPPIRLYKTDTMVGLDHALLLDVLLSMQVGEIILFEELERVFGPNYRKRPIYGYLAGLLIRLRKKGCYIVTVRHVGLLRLGKPPRHRRCVFGQTDREIWAMAETAPQVKIPD